MFDFIAASKGSRQYNFHTHTEFCDGKSVMTEMADAALGEGMTALGFSPHAPISVSSPCNMPKETVKDYLDIATRLKEEVSGMDIYTGMEVDFLSADCGPHTDYYQKLNLDYMIGSVHFVPNQDGIFIDCDGSEERFLRNLKAGFRGDLRYVVEKYFEQVLTMLERGGLDLLGHLDKIAANASAAESGIENESWYRALIVDVISHAASSDTAIEINTKAYPTKNRFFPAESWWSLLPEYGCKIIVNSDAHYADKISAGRNEAFELLTELNILQE